MRIDSSQSGPTVSESHLRAAGTQTEGSTAVAGGGPSVSVNVNEDQAQLSSTHLLAQALAAEAAQLPEVRQEKVSVLRQAVQSGDYNPDPEQVAGALFSHLGVNNPGAAGETGRRASQEWAVAM